jgi:DNA-binding NarL/FixJ family response regulator
MTERTLRVAVLTPQLVVAERLRAILASLRGGVEFVPCGRTVPDPDVVLYDAIGLVHGDRTDLKMLVDKTTAPLFVISRDPRPGLVDLARAAGANGCFSLGEDDEQLLAAIELAVHDARPSDSGKSPHRGLSRREAQFLGLIGQGWSNSEIVEELHLSPTTVKTYIRTAYRKIGAGNRAQAAAWAVTHGIARAGGRGTNQLTPSGS